MTIGKGAVQEELEAMGIDPSNPQVLFPWGFKVVEVLGSKWLKAMSPEEYREAVRKELGREVTSEELQNPRCFRSLGGDLAQLVAHQRVVVISQKGRLGLRDPHWPHLWSPRNRSKHRPGRYPDDDQVAFRSSLHRFSPGHGLHRIELQ